MANEYQASDFPQGEKQQPTAREEQQQTLFLAYQTQSIGSMPLTHASRLQQIAYSPRPDHLWSSCPL
jgi:hypothetical protein